MIDYTSQGNLVRLLDYDKDFIIDLRYATSDNFTHQKIYTSGECWIDKHTCEILIQAKNIFSKSGYKVKVWDAYRPISAQKKFWEILPDDNFVARPPDMSTLKTFRPTHMNGMAVDVTIVDMNGDDIEMPSCFDDTTEKASLSCPLNSDISKEHAGYLKQVMESVGFLAYEYEWWHFYDISAEPTPFMDFQI